MSFCVLMNQAPFMADRIKTHCTRRLDIECHNFRMITRALLICFSDDMNA